MGQKNHPLGLRIQSSTRYFDNSWYSGHFFTKLVSIDIFLSLYLNTFLKLFQLPFARFSIQHYPKTTKLYTFFCYPRQSREYKSKIFQIPSGLSNFATNKKNLRKQQLLFKNSIKDDVLWQHLITSPSSQKCHEEWPFLEKTSYEKWLISKFNKNIRLSPLNHSNKLDSFLSSKDARSDMNMKNDSDNLMNIDFKTSGIFSKDIVRSSNEFNINRANKTENLKKFLSRDFNELLKTETVLSPSGEKCHKEWPLNNIRHFASNLYMITKQNILNNTKIILHDTQFHATSHQKENMQLKYKNHIQTYISKHFNSDLKFLPFKVNQEWQDAGYFADEIVYLLERRVPFRRLKIRIIKQLALNTKIKGLRLTCSGRVGGKSKKAQRAKMDFIKYGQTSLHVFSSKIDFAVRTAYTPLGSTGIKVWICYK
jgi:hypothetical protein